MIRATEDTDADGEHSVSYIPFDDSTRNRAPEASATGRMA